MLLTLQVDMALWWIFVQLQLKVHILKMFLGIFRCTLNRITITQLMIFMQNFYCLHFQCLTFCKNKNDWNWNNNQYITYSFYLYLPFPVPDLEKNWTSAFVMGRESFIGMQYL